MREYVILFWYMMLGKIHPITFLYKCTTLGHRRKLMLVNPHCNGLRSRYDTVMIFRKIP